MSTSVELPALGESVTEGTISRWLKQVGDTVEVDEPLVEVSTDKVDTEIPSPVAGTLLEIKANEDDTVEVGAVLAIIGDADEGGSSDDDAPAADDESEDSGEEPVADDEEGRTNQQTDDPNRAEAAEEAGSDDSGEKPAKSGKSGGKSGTEVTLPELGESVTEGTVSRWLKEVGDTVEVDEPLLEISTDKVDTEIPSPVAGTLLEIKADTDDVVEVGGVLGLIGDADAAESAPEPEPAPAAEKDEPTEEQADDAEDPGAGDEGGQEPISAPTDGEGETVEPKAEESEPEKPEPKAEKQDESKAEKQPAVAPRASSGDSSAYVTPLVRKLAQQHGVDLDSLTGTGVGGRIRKQDVLAAAESAKQAPAAEEAPAPQQAPQTKAPAAEAPVSPKRGTTEKMSRLRKTIASRMVESLQVSAQLTATVEVDLTNVSRLRARIKDDFVAREGVKISHLAFIAKAAVEALKTYPNLNATVDTEAGEITFSESENLGIAVDTERGLMVPVIKNAGDLSIAGIARGISDLASKTRNSKIGPDDLTGGTFTITNYGSAGTLMDTPIINQPQVAILGTGALVKRPVVISDPNLGETIAVRDMMYLNLTYDHRVVDGADAARFLTLLKARLEEGDFGSEFGR
ncbi:2-oxoglutarate dehydrogenase, E2 component, dihydrolipoamide succinyltransferase [Naumannella halotolerans]|uniref:Dihydrolipoamide acetyltransferase component of pyruvate dehydrogenase complex n=1 Tax=Naumannella halotolerans TaxID=993414 RepID=A0A4R7J8D4_9ACTN|nr:2-oxoglutarate dehydrogenase, E2 component, dihydrolipoamide succinyltransferase [Naumannella halotolerans]TDT32733.1 2-oxoglutarate dehydrogenase E2 component (dihydrolipoamide succinyltransferase) [Naumannella halotolerans]